MIPLHWASKYGHLDVVKYFITHGSHRDSQDIDDIIMNLETLLCIYRQSMIMKK